jgi:benzoyl-CoA reductase/2-hydroxyglutaryl-CoA dehydratase subunit BcrC/BadD/HgdB
MAKFIKILNITDHAYLPEGDKKTLELLFGKLSDKDLSSFITLFQKDPEAIYKINTLIQKKKQALLKKDPKAWTKVIENEKSFLLESLIQNL